MADKSFPTKDSKGNNVTPHITKTIVETKEVEDSRLKKAAKMFFSEDIDHMTDSIMDDFVRPRTRSFGMDLLKKSKEFVYNSIVDFFGGIFFGTRSGSYKSSGTSYSRGGASYTSYSKVSSPYSNEYADDYYYYNGSYRKDTVPPDNIQHDIVRERPIRDAGKAQEVLDELRHVILTTKEHAATVADYYIAVGAKVTPLDYEYCWNGSMLDKCKPRYTRRGYILDLPKPIPKP